MSGAVIVTGMPRKSGMLRESLSVFRKHHEEVGAALLNISGIQTPTGEAVDKDEPRTPYRREDPVNDWPKMTYSADGKQEVVFNAAELKEAKAHGYRLEPYPVLRVAVESPAAEKALLVKQLEQSRAEVGTLSDELQKLKDQMAELLAAVRK